MCVEISIYIYMLVGQYIDKVFKQSHLQKYIGGLIMPSERKVIYEDRDVVVEIAPRDPELPALVYNFIRKKGRPVFFNEIVREFSGIVGEDRVRRAVSHLLALKKIVEFPDGSLGTPDMEWKPTGVRKRRRKRVARLMDIGEELAIPA